MFRVMLDSEPPFSLERLPAEYELKKDLFMSLNTPPNFQQFQSTVIKRSRSFLMTDNNM